MDSLEKIRNFVIISHIDHGKSTLADRFLELTGTVEKSKIKPQYLDSMNLEREKGITIKMHPCRMVWTPKDSLGAGNNEEFILNLVDTPGHIDFSYEISRALACVEGAILLVDATKGIQSQTIFNYEMAKRQGLKVIGALNKIDLAYAEVEKNKKELAAVLGVNPEKIFSISAKEGTNVEKLLNAIITDFPSPRLIKSKNNDFRALIFDSKYDQFLGVIAYVRIFQGEIKEGDKIILAANNQRARAKEVGYFTPELKRAPVLRQGEIGYIKTDIKEPVKVRVGDTISIAPKPGQPTKIEALPGYKEPQLVLFLSIYPKNPDEFDILKKALEKLKLNDPALDFQIESKMALGRGFKCGFLGSLHAEIFVSRLKEEFGLDLITTSPQVIFKVETKNGKNLLISSPTDWPEPAEIKKAEEPWVKLEVLTPYQYSDQISSVLRHFSAEILESRSLGTDKLVFGAEAPLREIISGSFYDRIKGVSQGYASFSFSLIGFRESDLVKVDILIAGQPEDAFAKIVPKEKAFSESKSFLVKLKSVLPPQQFSVSLQASLNGKIIARETIRALRKDVTAPLYGGDVTRKRKLLEIQKKGKKELKKKGRVNIPPKVFLEMLKS